ncbi:CPBP family intramembrane glutamic endopeptidase [Nocardiopsis potens]|uniref:CPBP family intramembrane glutamic endopeptidase n=1 Tax=Nocardiopsis potens TaxID=1246458 RepID=UPI000345892B|nr:CPBP family intramembrane glutamic endopeptidase [Nocardiopsis potens]
MSALSGHPGPGPVPEDRRDGAGGHPAPGPAYEGSAGGTVPGPGPEGTAGGTAPGPGPEESAGREAPPAPAPRVGAAPAGTPYHLLARNRWNSWWRPIAGTAAFLVPALVVMVALSMGAGVVAFLNGGMDAGDDPVAMLEAAPLAFLGATLLGLASALPMVLLTARLVQRRPAGTLSSVAGRFRRRWALACAGAAAAAIALGYAVSVATYLAAGRDLGEVFGAQGWEWSGWGAFLPAAALVLLLVPFQAAAEEYVFRGWLMQAFGSFIRTPWPGIVAGSLLFMSVHGYTGWGAAWIFVWAMTLAWLSVRTGGLEAAVVMHVLHNLTGMLVTSAMGDIAAPLDQGAVPWEFIPGALAQTFAFVALTVFLARRRGVRTRS